MLGAIGRFLTIHKIFHVEILAVATTSAEAHAVGFVQFTVARAVIAFKEAVLNTLYSKIQTPILTVDGDIHKTAKGRSSSELIHHGVGQIVLHHGGILDEIVQTELVESVIGDGIIIVVKLHLEAISLTVHGGNRGQGGITLATDAYVFIGFAVNHHGSSIVFLACGIGNKLVPIVHDNINGMHLRIVKQTVFISHGMCHSLKTKYTAVHKQNGNDQYDCCDSPCYFVKMFAP